MRWPWCLFLLIPALLLTGRTSANENYATRRHRIQELALACTSDLSCGGHGACVQGHGCICYMDPNQGFWDGEACDRCRFGWTGTECTLQCKGHRIPMEPNRPMCVVCSGHGTCFEDGGVAMCACDGKYGGEDCSSCRTGYFGEDCSDSCPGTETGLACNGHGECVNKACNCTGSFVGISCSDCDGASYGEDCAKTCTGVVTGGGPDSGKPCSGHGLCFHGLSGNGSCVCDPFYGGVDCSLHCPSECSGNGVCLDGADRLATCACLPTWSPPDCSICIANMTGDNCTVHCPIDRSGRLCSGNGNCTHTNDEPECICASGFGGFMCDVVCPGDPSCSRKGVCEPSDTGHLPVCRCNQEEILGFWSGSNCSDCSLLYNNSQDCNVACPVDGSGRVCHGHGQCIEGNCYCERNELYDYSGEACLTRTFRSECTEQSCVGDLCPKRFRFGNGCVNKCPGLDPAESYVCNGHGFCDEGLAGSGACACEFGWGGTECQLACPVSVLNQLPCSGRFRGTCSADGTCECREGYAGSACNVTCAVVAGLVCSNHGNCTVDATSQAALCACDAMWTGRGCDVPCGCNVLHGRCNATACSSNLPNEVCRSCSCFGNFTGTCNECLPGSRGQDCDDICKFGRTVGTECKCEAHWSHPGCDVACLRGKNGRVCSGNGNCQDGSKRDGSCLCDDDWFGSSCDVPCHPLINCTHLDNAQCNVFSGECECLDDDDLGGHFVGDKCDRCNSSYWGPSCSELCDCSGHGDCDEVSGACRCHASDSLGFFTGLTCNDCAEGYIGEACRIRNAIITQLPPQKPAKLQGLSDRLHQVNTSLPPSLPFLLVDDYWDTSTKTHSVDVYAGASPVLHIDGIGFDKLSVVGTTNRSLTSSLLGCADGAAPETARVFFEPLARERLFYLQQPSENCSLSVRIIPVDRQNMLSDGGAVLLFSDIVPGVMEGDLRRVIVSAVLVSRDTAQILPLVLVAVLCHRGVTDHRVVPGCLLVRIDVGKAYAVSVAGNVQTANLPGDFVPTDIDVTYDKDTQRDSVVVGGRREVPESPSLTRWDALLFNSTLLPFYTGHLSVEELVSCWPVEADPSRPCAACPHNTVVRFVGSDLLVGLDFLGEVKGVTTPTSLLASLSPLHLSTQGMVVNVLDNNGQCSAVETQVLPGGSRDFVAADCIVTATTPFCKNATLFATVSKTSLSDTSPASLVVDFVVNMAYLSLERPLSDVTSPKPPILAKFAVDLADFGLVGVLNLGFQAQFPEVFPVMAVAATQRALYATVRDLPRLVVLRFLLADVRSVYPPLADRRGGSPVTITGSGFDSVVLCGSRPSSPGQATPPVNESGCFKAQCLFPGSAAPAVIVNSTHLTCMTKRVETSAAACTGQFVEVNLFTGSSWTTNNQLPFRFVDPPTLRGIPSPDRGSVDGTPGGVIVHGEKFVNAPSMICRYNVKNATSSRFFYGRGTYRDTETVLCEQNSTRGMESAAGSGSSVDVSLDGSLFSETGGLLFQIVGAAANISAMPPYVVVQAQAVSNFNVTVMVIDSSNQPLGALATMEYPIMLTGVRTEVCNPTDFAWHTPEDGPEPCRELQFNGNSTIPTDPSDILRVAVVGEAQFSEMFFMGPRAQVVTITLQSVHHSEWRTVFEVRIIPGKPTSLAVLNRDEIANDGGEERKYAIYAEKPLETLYVGLLDSLGNVISDIEIANQFVVFAAFFAIDDVTHAVTNSTSRVTGRFQKFRGSFASAFKELRLPFVHGVSHHVHFFSEPLLRETVTPTLRTAYCSALQYKQPHSGKCFACPAKGAVCNGTEIVRVLPGFWRANSTESIYECVGGKAVCPGTTGNAPTECSGGYEGPLCSLCKPGYGKASATECKECPDKSTSITIVVFASIFGLIIVLVWSIVTLRKAEQTDVSVIMRTLVNHAQATGELNKFSNQYDTFLNALINTQGSSSSMSVNGIQSVSCVLSSTNSDYEAVFTFYMCLPLLAVFLGLVVFVIVRVTKLKPVITEKLREEIEEDVRTLGSHARTKILLERYPLYMVIVTTLSVTMFTLYQTLIAQSTRVLRCKELVIGRESDGTPITEEYLEVDMSMKCNNGSHSFSMAALMCAIGYGFGIPVMFVAGYKFVNGIIAKPELTKLMFMFLTGGYKPQYWYWQAVIMIRKMVLVLVIVFLEGNPQLQSYCGMWSMSVALILQIWLNPNEKDEHNLVEALSLAIITTTLNLGLLTFWPDLDRFGVIVVRAILTIITLGALLMFAYFLYQPLKQTAIASVSLVVDKVKELRSPSKKKDVTSKKGPCLTLPAHYSSRDGLHDEDDEDAQNEGCRQRRDFSAQALHRSRNLHAEYVAEFEEVDDELAEEDEIVVEDERSTAVSHPQVSPERTAESRPFSFDDI